MKSGILFSTRGHEGQRLVWAVSFLLMTFGILEDYLESQIRDFSFYISESFLFSTHWIFLVPLTALQLLWIKKSHTHPFATYIIGFFVPVALHIICYPAWVNLVSGIFFEHRFAFRQTFSYAVSTQLIPIGIWYALPLLFRGRERKHQIQMAINNPLKTYEEFFMVTHGGQKVKVAVDDIIYISAQTPYVSLHQEGKKILMAGSLSSIGDRLDPERFIRIHRSTIVPLDKVVSYQSRLNGDYDARLCDGTLLRVSRNYAAAFKKGFNSGHRLNA